MNNLKNNLKYYRNLQKKTQKEIAIIIGVATTTYANWEQGTREPSIDILIKICDYYKTTLDEIIKG